MPDDSLSNMISVAPPAEYRNCAQLAEAIKTSVKRQNQLEDLERKAGTGIGSVFARSGYGPELLKEHANEINMRRSAREKACKLPASLPPLDRR